MSRHTRSGRRRGPSKARNATSLIFSFFLALSLVIELTLLIAYMGFFSEKGFISVLDDEYYQLTLDYINQEATYYTMPTGFDPEVLEGVFQVEEVRKDVGRNVTSAFRGNNYEPDETGERERLANNVRALYKSDGAKISKDDEKAISTYVDEIMTIYRKATKMPGLDAIAKVRNRLVKISLMAAIAVGVIIILLAIAIVKMHHYMHRGLRYVAYATGGAALISLVAPAFTLLSGTYKHLGVQPQFFYHFCMSLIERLLFLFLIGATALFTVTLVVVIVVATRRHALMSSRRHHHWDE